MHTTVKDKLYTVSEYLAPEERAKHKHAYFNGIISKMPVATYNFNSMATNVLVELSNLLSGKNF